MPAKIQPALVPCEDLQGEQINPKKGNARTPHKKKRNYNAQN